MATCDSSCEDSVACRVASAAYSPLLSALALSAVQQPHSWSTCATAVIAHMQAHIECQLTIEEETKETCRQTLEGDVDIHIFGLGKIAEGIIADNLKKVYSGIPAIVER